MMSVIDKISTEYIWLLLVFMRIIGIFIIAPFYSSAKIMSQLKVGLTLLLSVVVFFSYDFSNLVKPELDVMYISLIFKELAIGLFLGFILLLYFSIFNMAGNMIDAQIGFSMSSAFDPMSNSNVTVTANLYYTSAMLIFFSINGHHWMIESMVKSFDILPLGNVNVKWGLVEQFISNFSEVFELSFKVAMPIMVTIFIANVTLGFLAKTVPQMNVFVVGMPMKVAIGLVLLTLTAPLFVKTASKIFEITEFEFLELLKHMKW